MISKVSFLYCFVLYIYLYFILKCDHHYYRKKQNLSQKLAESIESFKFVSHRARISGEFDLRKDSHSTEFERRPIIFVFRELCDSKLSGLHHFDNIVIIH